MFIAQQEVPYQNIPLKNDIRLVVKRIDLVHHQISGNKFFKLKYNFLNAQELGFQRILSFGGAYSNHIYALAHAAHDYGFQSIGIIRGQELKDQALNPTLQAAQDLGMRLEFISRQAYREKNHPDFIQQLKLQYPSAYIIPEGGTNALAVKGCEEILSEDDIQNFDVICCAVGTGGTISGIINASHDHQQVIGFAALKANFLTEEIKPWVNKHNWNIYTDDYFGGYGKYNTELVKFIQNIQQQFDLPLEPIYTGKAFYYLQELIQKNHFPVSTRILFIHTGGLQAFSAYH